MKTTFENTDELKGAVKALAAIYHAYVKPVDEDKHLDIIVTKTNQTALRVMFSWHCDDSEDPEIAYDYFTLLRSDNFLKLEKYVNDSMDLVTQQKLLIS